MGKLLVALILITIPVMPQQSWAAQLLYTDVHGHLDCFNDAAPQQTLSAMDSFGVQKTFVMPPPSAFLTCDFLTFMSNVIAIHPDRFAFLDGGKTLTKIIQESLNTTPSEATFTLFEQTANNILSHGAMGFGEMAALHFDLEGTGTQPFIGAPPDHPLFLKLADIAAANNVVINLHMEAAPCVVSTADGCGIPLPDGLGGPVNPSFLPENIVPLETLLEHNRNARIMWDHAGWDNTGYRTVALIDSLLKKHPNLYMNIKMRGSEKTSITNRPLDGKRQLRPEWLALLNSYPSRFTIGVDSMYPVPHEGGLNLARDLLNQLPPDLANKVGFQNALEIYTQAGAVPACTLTASPSTIILGSSATLTATCSPAATGYTWTSAPGLVPGLANAATVTPTATGTFQYSVTGINSSGVGNTASTSVTVIVPAFHSQSDCLFNWAQVNYSSLFAPASSISNTLATYYYRYYPQTGAYLATSSADNHVYYLGPLSSYSILDVGALSGWLSTAGCQ